MGLNILFPLVVLVLSLQSPCPVLVDSATLSILTDKQALLSFKSSTKDPSNTLQAWNDSSNVCSWNGVFCNRFRQRVLGLDLNGFGLTGTISPHIGNLSFLRYVRLQDNQLTGTIPSQIGNLFRLQELNISSNLLQGAIPPNISKCAELTVLDAANNQISGPIPPMLGSLSKLQVLRISQNRLSGVIPPSIGNLSLLTTLDLRTNSLTGTIPSDLGHLSKLKDLQISINNLTGVVPSPLYNLSSLVTFALASNQLWGDIPSDVGFKLPNLLVFHICFNKFTGKIPPSLHNVTKIQSIRMSYNFLTGSVPQGLERLGGLKMFNIGFNRIVSSGATGLNFITSLTNSTVLEYLAFDGNLLEGIIPQSIGNLSASLVKLYMGQNRIYGRIPASTSSLSTNLALLNLNDNLISGEIPPEIGQLNLLQELGLAGNRISGEIPDSLGNLSSLNRLEIFGNDLEGSIPTTFGSYQRLLSLDLSNNRLNGSIPKEVFTLSSLGSILNLSRNSLEGSLPQEVGMLENIAEIDVSDNRLSGSIPESIGSCKSLQNLYMSNNLFSGPIPGGLGLVKGLQNLDLSLNHLSGEIPSDLQKLRALQFLNLSFNDLQGEVPKQGIFSNLSGVYLEGNSKLCKSSACERSPVLSHHRTISRKLRIIIATAGVLVVCVVVSSLWILFCRGNEKAKIAPTSESLGGRHLMVSYEDLLAATHNFDPENLIGSGSFGSVYKGNLRDGIPVAVKVLDLERNGASKSFQAECEALRNVRHRNLVKLITSCSSIDRRNVDFRALVYELMSYGNLEEWIRGQRKHDDGGGLNVVERLNIAIDVACAMEYLHHDCEAPVVHCDLKPSNVLLDEETTAKVGDFGLARLVIERGGGQLSTTHGLKGTIGYIPPEYGLGGKPSTKGDVYSYGIMLLELFTGKSPTHPTFVGELSLPKWVLSAFPSMIMQVIDSAMLQINYLYYEGQVVSTKMQQDSMVSVIGVGLSCIVDSPDMRISMREVLHKLKGIKETLLKPTSGNSTT